MTLLTRIKKRRKQGNKVYLACLFRKFKLLSVVFFFSIWMPIIFQSLLSCSQRFTHIIQNTLRTFNFHLVGLHLIIHIDRQTSISLQSTFHNFFFSITSQVITGKTTYVTLIANASWVKTYGQMMDAHHSITSLIACSM